MTFLRQTLTITILTFMGSSAWAFEVPKGLSLSDRLEVIRTLGLNAATKLIDNPYPLGGYSGFEIGYSFESIDIRNLRELGCSVGSLGCANTSVSDETDWRLSRIMIGKGLYDDIDVFFHFIPPIGSTGISDYGGALRWSFYQPRLLPINLSALGHFDQLNYRDSFMNRNIGLDFLAGINIDYFAAYLGVGFLQASGTFSSAVVASDGTIDQFSNTVNDKVNSVHTMFGMSVHYLDTFAAAELDHYEDEVYSFKFGLRF